LLRSQVAELFCDHTLMLFFKELLIICQGVFHRDDQLHACVNVTKKPLTIEILIHECVSILLLLLCCIPVLKKQFRIVECSLIKELYFYHLVRICGFAKVPYNKSSFICKGLNPRAEEHLNCFLIVASVSNATI
jgi:hypothetical protein